MVRRSIAAALAAACVLSLAACCGDCIKDPPCRPCENPCCLTPIQRMALEKGTHALDPSTPTLYTYNEKPYVFFTEKGLEEFRKDPSAYEEKGATRVIRAGKTWRVDVSPGDAFDWESLKAMTPTPYVVPPAGA